MREGGKVSLTDVRPQLLGFDQTAAGLLMLTNHVIAQRIEAGRGSKVQMIKGPVFPIEIVEMRLAKYAKGKREGGIEAAQARYAAKKAKGLPVIDGVITKTPPVKVVSPKVKYPHA